MRRPDTTKVSVPMTEEEKQILEDLCEKHGMSQATIVRQALRRLAGLPCIFDPIPRRTP